MADPPDFQAARRHVLTEVIRFADRLRDAGVAVPANAALSAVAAVVEVGLDDRDRVRAALQATFVQHPGELDAFDDHFGEFWYRLRTGLEATATVDETDEANRGGADEPDGGVRQDLAGTGPDSLGDDGLEADGEHGDVETDLHSRRVADDASDAEATADDQRTGTYSAAGRRTAIDAETPGGATRVDRSAIRRFEAALATLSGRRWTRARAGEGVDVRRALRESVETGGVAMALPERERNETDVRVCLLVDVSRSVLDAIDRSFLLSFVSALVADSRAVRTFFFDTDIREVTAAFASSRRDAGAALADAEVAWGGGTRIGESLATLRREWPHAVDHRTATVIVSDGLDVGEIDELEREMAWLAGRSRAVVWLNPLAASAEYEPACRGMAAALPYVDGLFAFGSNADLREVARQLERHGPAGPVGYEHDFRNRRAES